MKNNIKLIFKKNNFAGGALLNSAGSYVILILTVIRTFLYGYVLSPEKLGVLGQALLFIEYGSYLHFGLLYYFDREYPQTDILEKSKSIQLFLFIKKRLYSIVILVFLLSI